MRVQKFWGDGKKCRINLFIEQRTAKHHNKHRVKTLKIQDISVGRDVKTFSEEKCPRGRQMPKQLWQRKKGGKYEWTEGTTIIYVNNVPLLLIISGKIKQKRKKKRGGGGGGNITHVTQLIFLMQINNRNYKWKWCCCDRERKGETIERCPAFSLSPPFSFLHSVWNSLAGEASTGRCSLTQRVKSIAEAGGEKLALLFWTEWLYINTATVFQPRGKLNVAVIW